MPVERHDDESHLRNLHDDCQKHMYHYVTLTLTDGRTIEGIIEKVDTDNMTVLVAEDVMDNEGEHGIDTRQYYGGFVHPRRRYRCFSPQVLPLAALATLALLPYVYQSYQPYPPYPYYPQYPQYPHYPYY